MALALSAGVVTAAESGAELHSERVTPALDWQPLDWVPLEQQDLRCRQCNGAFVDPLAGLPEPT